MVFQFAERRAFRGGNDLAAEFHGQRRRIAVQAGQQGHFHALVHLRRFMVLAAQQAGQRRDETVGQQDADEGAHQRLRDQHAQLGRRQADGGHRVHDAHDGGHDAEGGHGVGQLRNRLDRHFRIFMVRLDLVIHQVFDLVSVHIARHHQAQIIGDEFQDVLVTERVRVFDEDGTAVRVVDIVLDRHQAFLADLAEDFIHQPHQFHIARLRVLRAVEQGGQGGERGADGLGVIADKEGAQRGAADHQQFQRLEQGAQVTALHGEAAEDGKQHDEKSEYD